MLKPQDVVISLKILTINAPWSQRELAKSLCLSLSEISMGIRRAGEAGLLLPGQKNPRIHAAALKEFLFHGIKYAFRPAPGKLARGVPTGAAGPDLKELINSPELDFPVWPYKHGTARGYSLEPLYPTVPEACSKKENHELYRALALADAIREGRARESKLAGELLEKMIGSQAHHE